MKATTYLVNYQPYLARDEHCTLGAVVFAEDGKARVHLAHNLKKVKALDPQANLQSLRETLSALVQEINEKSAAWDVFKTGVAGVRFSANPGFFAYATPEEYERQIQWLLQVAAEPRSPQTRKVHQSKSRLFVELKSTFKNYGWLGEKANDIENHKVVTHYPIVVDQDLNAEFAIRNGRLHLMETVDFRSGVSSVKRMEARGKALVFDAAREQDAETSCTVVIAAQDYAEIKSSMNLLHRYADRVAVYDSVTDMQSLFTDWAGAMNRPMLDMPN